MNSDVFIEWCQQYRLNSAEPASYCAPLLMGILNTTPDSFSDGGRFVAPAVACQHALLLAEQGADIIDIGGESSRPGAEPVSVDEELARVIPVIEKIRNESDVCLSIDTTKPVVMQEAVAAGVSFINDINALRSEGALEMAAHLNVPVCLMHMQGEPQTMQQAPYYPQGVLADVHHFFNERIEACLQAGILMEHLILDPGFGFGKTIQDNVSVLKELHQLQQYQLPLLLGVSRKSAIGALLNQAVNDRLIGSITAAVHAVGQGVSIIRTHDVAETRQAFLMMNAIYHNQHTLNQDVGNKSKMKDE